MDYTEIMTEAYSNRSETSPISDWILFLETGTRSLEELCAEFYPHTVRKQSAKKAAIDRLADVDAFLKENMPWATLKRLQASIRSPAIFWVERNGT